MVDSRTSVLPPTTPSIIQGYKEPLRPVDKGFGYMGVVTYTKEKTHTQCHICGYFFKSLGQHILKEHKIPAKAYKKKYGLNVNKSLVAPNAREPYFKQWEKLTPKEKKAKMEKMKQASMTARQSKSWSKSPKNLEDLNVDGRCPDQLLDKIICLQKVLGDVPTSKQFARHYKGYIHSVEDTFGSWNEALKILNLVPKRGGWEPIYSKKMVTEMLKKFRKTYGREPYARDTRDGNLPSMKVMVRLFGSWKKAKEMR